MRGEYEVDGGRQDHMAAVRSKICLLGVESTQMKVSRPPKNVANPCSRLRKLLGLVEHPENDADTALLEVPIQPAPRGQIALQSYHTDAEFMCDAKKTATFARNRTVDQNVSLLDTEKLGQEASGPDSKSGAKRR